ncbi:MAG: PP2C family protein-serine/threonine phosphatase, partial [Bacteroidota bacterium]
EEVMVKEKQLKYAEGTMKEMKAETEEQRMKIDLLNKENQLKELKLKEEKARRKNQAIILQSTVGIVMLLILIALILILGIRQKQRANRLLDRQNQEIKAQQEIIRDRNRKILQSINYAKKIQKAILPAGESFKEYFPESFVFFEPRDVVSGDFYWFSDANIKSVISKDILSPNENSKKVYIVSAIDCTGHGVPGAFMSMVGYNIMQNIISKGIISPEKILTVLNTGVKNLLKQDQTDLRDGMDMALCVVKEDEGIVEFAGAKNPLVYFVDGQMNVIKGDKMPIGGFLQNLYKNKEFTKHTIKITKPTTFYLYSDGFQDQVGGEKGRKFLSTKFREFLAEIHQKPMAEQKEIIGETLENWKGNYSQDDDILIMGFRVDPKKT